MKRIIAIHIAIVLASAALADMPTAFTYQGRLSDGAGATDGSFDFIFDLYPQMTGGTELVATDSHAGVAVANGYFNVSLDFGAGVFDGSALFVETRVRPAGGGAYETLTPRQPIMPAPYAMFAENVRSGAVGESALDDGAVTSAKIYDGTISFGDIGQNGASSGQVMKWSGSAWVAADDVEGGGTGGVTDHGALTGLGDDDHPQYLRSNVSDVYNDAGADASLRFEGGDDPNLLYISGALDAIGIGTGGPVGKLQVVGDEVRIGGGGSVVTATGTGDLYVEDNLEVDGFTIIDDDVAIGDGIADYDSTAEYLRISAQSANWYLGVLNEGSIDDSDFYVGTDYDDEDTFCIERDGSIGIGTSSPGLTRLKVRNDAGALAGAALWAENAHASGIALVTEVDSSQPNTFLTQLGSGNFLTCFNGEDYPISLKKDGTVDCKVLNITGGSDVAEPFPTAGGKVFAPGTVLVIDDETPGALRLAETPYDRCVAGVVSGAGGVNPGVMLHQTGSVADGDCPVALSGRAYVRADASYGSIRPGDLLTTSATPGHAMRVSDHGRALGAVLGKAMSPLDEGTGLVLVLISLQ